jgi:16S rRNA (cytosine1402-N4)-methyltransferase
MRASLGAFVAVCGRSIRKHYGGASQSLSSLSENTIPPAAPQQQSQPFASTYHAPVMWQECVDALLLATPSRYTDSSSGSNTVDAASLSPPLLFVDGTLGGGGHTEALLRASRDAIVFGCDVDLEALATATVRLQDFVDEKRFIPVHSNFCDLSRDLLANLLLKDNNSSASNSARCEDVAQRLRHDGVDGVLLDLGVSSHQIDTPARGFAFQQDGPLDMRMDASSKKAGGLTAADLCNEMDVFELKRILKTYGDEPRATAIANSIVKHRPLTTTKHLEAAVAAVTPAFHKNRRAGRTATLARVFQALRITVNREADVLAKVLTEVAPALIRPAGGRLVVLSYHSMEDRAAKRIMRDGTLTKRVTEKDVYGNYAGPVKPFRPVGKSQKASEAEVAVNSRARSATLRVAERT